MWPREDWPTDRMVDDHQALGAVVSLAVCRGFQLVPSELQAANQPGQRAFYRIGMKDTGNVLFVQLYPYGLQRYLARHIDAHQDVAAADQLRLGGKRADTKMVVCKYGRRRCQQQGRHRRGEERQPLPALRNDSHESLSLPLNQRRNAYAREGPWVFPILAADIKFLLHHAEQRADEAT